MPAKQILMYHQPIGQVEDSHHRNLRVHIVVVIAKVASALFQACHGQCRRLFGLEEIPSYSITVAMDSLAWSLILRAELSCMREKATNPEIVLLTPRLEMIIIIMIVLPLRCCYNSVQLRFFRCCCDLGKYTPRSQHVKCPHSIVIIKIQTFKFKQLCSI